MTAITTDLREYFSKIGSKGGSVRSKAKAEAAKLNGQKPKRKRKKRPKSNGTK